MKRHGCYSVIFETPSWRIFKAQGDINQVLVKNLNTTETYAFARYSHKVAIFAEEGTPYAWLPVYIRARVVKALDVVETLTAGRNVPCAY